MPSGSQDISDWERHSDIENMAKARDLVVIVPPLFKSTGANMAMGPRVAEFVAKELPETLRTIFRFLSDKREDNFISGFSNGGFACFYIAMNYPECYAAAGGLAAGDGVLIAECQHDATQVECEILNVIHIVTIVTVILRLLDQVLATEGHRVGEPPR